MASGQNSQSCILSSTDHRPEGFKWLTLKRIKYRDPKGRERIWESAERTTRKGPLDGVAIIAQVSSKGKPTELVLESQFRPSQGNYVIEFPAGLVDQGETAEQAALRELKEETGYRGKVVDVSAVGFSDPGMTNSNMQAEVDACKRMLMLLKAVTITVDADAPENKVLEPELEDGEFIEVFLLPMDNLYNNLQAMHRAKGWDIDARLLLYALGIKQATLLAQGLTE